MSAVSGSALPSGETMKKLKAFQFLEGRPSPSALTSKENKENQQPKTVSPARPNYCNNNVAQQIQTSSVRGPEIAAVGTASPCTPLSRSKIPLQHLLADLNPNPIATQCSPSLQAIGWKQPTPPQGRGTPGKTPQRQAKRARSSSPPASSESRRHRYRTPKHNPAADIWSRYRGNDRPEPSMLSDGQEGVEGLLIKSSPRPSENAGSVGGLRRYNSCGYQFPQARKRRRTASCALNSAHILLDTIAPENEPESKVSKIDQLLKALHHGKHKASRSQIATGGHLLANSPSMMNALPLHNEHVAQVVFNQHSISQPISPIPSVKVHPEPVAALTEIESSKTNEAELREVCTTIVTVQATIPATDASDHEFSDLDLDDHELTVLSHYQINTSEAPELRIRAPSTLRDATIVASHSTIHGQQEQELHQNPERLRDADHNFIDENDEFADVDLADDEWNQVADVVSAQPGMRSLQWEEDVAGKATSTALEYASNHEDHHPKTEHSHGHGIKTDTQVTHMGIYETSCDDSNDFDADDYDDADFIAAEKQSVAMNNAHHRLTIQRYKVKSISEGFYKGDHGMQQSEKIVTAVKESSGQLFHIHLRQSWYETDCQLNTYIHVFGVFDASGRCTIDNSKNMLVLHPDHLVSATVVADSFGCMRRAVLQDRVKSTTSSSTSMLYGNILHELCQSALASAVWDPQSLERTLVDILPRHFETMVELNLTIEQVCEYTRPRIAAMCAWAAAFVQSPPARRGTVQSRSGNNDRMAITNLLDIEEHVWSPAYGLKGNIDATVEISLEEDGRTRHLTVPLELKTGARTSEAHHAQTALYTLLISDRYDIDASNGILYYLELSKTVRIEAVRHELIHMIMKRNKLASYIRDRSNLPPMLEKHRQRLCNGCYAQSTCHIYHRLSENGDEQALDRKELFQTLVAPLNEAHAKFFRKWDDLITKEESDMLRLRRELWTMLSGEREGLHRCFGNVVIKSDPIKEISPSMSKINRYQYTFIKPSAEPAFSFTDSQLTVGEPVVVSDEQGHFALANGYVIAVRKRSITVAVDRSLSNTRRRRSGFCSQTNQSFIGAVGKGSDDVDLEANGSEPRMLYRLDKDEFSNGMATVRNNLIQIMNNGVYKAADLRSTIIDDRAPTFREISNAIKTARDVVNGTMNMDQLAAISKVIAARDFALILGMPGTGKTTTIAQIIQNLVSQDKTVLLASYTHTAVDNILIKLKQSNIAILRLGNLAKIHAEVRDFAMLGAEQRDTPEAVYDAWHAPPVVATTCLGISHPIFTQRTFDFCIVDEASQITLPVCLGPIRMANTFVLVGDHYQLPPIVQNRAALEGGLDMSLFRLLCEKYPHAVVSLEHQYRMSADIMSIANELIYSGRLKCGSEIVASRSLSLVNAAVSFAMAHSSPSIRCKDISGARQCITTCRPHTAVSQTEDCWLSPLLRPSNRVVFLNTDTLGQPAEEITVGNRTTNPVEADLTAQIAALLVDAGLSSSDLGIITFYRSQLALLRRSLRQYDSIELHTADKFQGRDKEAVIVSFVRHNNDGIVGDLLQDWRRINVAVTRARSKLILLGSARTLEAGPEALRSLVDMCRRRNWLWNLPVGAADMHAQLRNPKQSQTPACSAEARQTRNYGMQESVYTSCRHCLVDQGDSGLTDIAPDKSSSHRAKPTSTLSRNKAISGQLLMRKPIIRDIMNDSTTNSIS